MSIDRRTILFAAAALATTSQYAESHTREKPVSQQELDEAIRLHGLWLADMNTGQRCMFGGRDLSGLQFGVLSGGPIDLNGADFTQADLSGTEADDILPNGALQLFVVPHNVLSPISAMLFCTTPTCLKHGYAVISTAQNYVTHLWYEQICPLAISWVQSTTK
jgi:hypothetical protein